MGSARFSRGTINHSFEAGDRGRSPGCASKRTCDVGGLGRWTPSHAKASWDDGLPAAFGQAGTLDFPPGRCRTESNGFLPPRRWIRGRQERPSAAGCRGNGSVEPRALEPLPHAADRWSLPRTWTLSDAGADGDGASRHLVVPRRWRDVGISNDSLRRGMTDHTAVIRSRASLPGRWNTGRRTDDWRDAGIPLVGASENSEGSH
jgi:hypothetical protein